MGLNRRRTEMASKKHRPEEAVAKLRQVDVLVSQGQSVADAIRAIGVTEDTYYRWRREFGGLKADQGKRLKALGGENARRRKVGGGGRARWSRAAGGATAAEVSSVAPVPPSPQGPRPPAREEPWTSPVPPCGAGQAGLVQRKSAPSRHMRCRTMPSLRVTATTAFCMPRRFTTA